MESQVGFLFQSLECGNSSLVVEKENLGSCKEKDHGQMLKEMNIKIRKVEEMTAKNNILLERILNILKPPKIELNIFPIESIDALRSTESMISAKNYEDIVTYLKQKFSKRPLWKVIDEMVGESLLLKVNWDGTKKKEALNKYTLFNTFLYDALKDDYSFPEFEQNMKKGFLKCKAQFYRKTYKLKK